jgi:hypothetical protein
MLSALQKGMVNRLVIGEEGLEQVAVVKSVQHSAGLSDGVHS